MVALVDHIFRQVGRGTALANAEAQHREAVIVPKATLGEHIEEFTEYWQWKLSGWLSELPEAELTRFDRLSTENERDAVRIIQSFARLAASNSERDFKIQCQSLADRLGITLAGASKIRMKLSELGFIRPTAPYVPKKFAARFKWVDAPGVCG
jgi:hypothetical protein